MTVRGRRRHFAVAACNRVEHSSGFTIVDVVHRMTRSPRCAAASDLLLLDICLSDLTGLRVLHRLRSTGRWSTSSSSPRPGRWRRCAPRWPVGCCTTSSSCSPAPTRTAARHYPPPVAGRVGGHRWTSSARLSAARPAPAVPDLPRGGAARWNGERKLRETSTCCPGRRRRTGGDVRQAARRYLSTADVGRAQVRPRYGQVGRPQHLYSGSGR